MPTYRKILHHAWKITSRHKILWFLGFWVALLGNGGEYDLLINNLRGVTPANLSWNSLPGFFTTDFITQHFLIQFKNLILAQNPLQTLGLLLVFGGLIYLTITAQGALIESIYLRLKKKTKIDVRRSWIATREKFWLLLFTNIIFKGVGAILAFLLSWPFIILFQAISGLSFTVSAIVVGVLILTPLLIIASFLVKLTILYIITKNKDPLSALGAGVELFYRNWLLIMENALLLFVLSLLTGLVTLGAVLLISFPIISAISMAVYPMALPDGYYITIIAWLLIIVGPILGSILAVFQYATWTTLFNKLNGKRVVHAKIARLAAAGLARLMPVK
ncbi:MAG: hypothetical protein A2445_01215 [Candidatus Jacksonbacteria bacterium RIFOXYC2_FULL_44_29]|nr:MAG: hypothetical protein UW45_C0013G0006 [Parcubacteria group bacterium GW2011_GWC2_44_22]OGY74956.1 MAG: hypothetical protein A2240_05245 [Candidatus Jacksonbacteria bacterium RIFOXYA2_FULL_43_12]OGY76509.1 MAG: hypothetical protein A2295_02030 [Candidatus Jacksonbacteria bacterium RIFOXYB2_FULL_44_15]OGY78489.1 MAG: hypothetical protein A2445_01215 [Candidatus Jacksonbacteria bacterium RIFOXYC2_FULL_44_29]OGY81146.1 MAG: hypothetical protein A2550_01610 [Candidatus Jacksonbacteria bacteri